ncbi:tetrapyrrole methylase family protein / MazG family protein [Psychrobacillus sp. OK028]|uniref:nucleoside triphosphate pyrophosphohydrolase n=1 Tax=Psychrobacillus sp. OK028 TaxID=1884359 RepID=UPI00088321A5|nr:nucleoside triphosphate pyrophosphohydrolase [Psychrobacillus sp. OK028]SDO27854.1 tetrapyrrole methylase family protein / MazG family protein [Psychrobacillus sp. OK028]
MNEITIIGLGAGDLDQLPLGIYKKLKAAKYLYVRTEQHPVLDELKAEGLTFTGFDDVYENNEQFEGVYEEIVKQLLDLAKKQSIIYAVPGHPLVAELTVQLLIEADRQGQVKIHIEGGQSFLDPIFGALRIDPIEGFQLLDGTSFKRDEVQMNAHVLIGQVYDAFSASEVKLTLMEKYPDDYEVTIVTAAGSAAENLTKVPLFELDRVMKLDNLTTLYVPPIHEKENRLKEWQTLRQIVADLRGPNGCPWDKEQTHTTLKKYAVEEVYELLQAIDEEDDDHIVEELGDVLLQVFLHAQIGEDNGYFSMEDVLNSIADKMIRRHPHVFGSVKADSTEDVLRNWQQIKSEENRDSGDSLLEGEMRADSSLLTSFNYQKKVAKVGFDWPDVSGAWEKFEEELAEWKTELAEGTKESQVDELGDVLFTIVNLARFYQLSPEQAMIQANKKFKSRFQFIEQSVKDDKGDFSHYTLEELDQFWKDAKKLEG